MSKERALLIRAFTAIDSRDFPVLCKDIKELLAQSEQELVYDLPSWENGYAAGRSAENERLLTLHLSTSAPKPERWSDLNRQQVYEKGWRDGYEEKLLTQPEQEPVAQLPCTSPQMTPREMYQRGYAAAERDLKRETVNIITSMDKIIGEHAGYIDGFTDGILYAEEHHGIGE